jgi:hypothetical protein
VHLVLHLTQRQPAKTTPGGGRAKFRMNCCGRLRQSGSTLEGSECTGREIPDPLSSEGDHVHAALDTAAAHSFQARPRARRLETGAFMAALNVCKLNLSLHNPTWADACWSFTPRWLDVAHRL